MERNPVTQFFVGLVGMEPKVHTAPSSSPSQLRSETSPSKSGSKSSWVPAIPFLGGKKSTDHEGERAELFQGAAASGPAAVKSSKPTVEEEIHRANDQHDKTLDHIGDALRNIKAQALEMNTEIKVHNVMIDDLTVKTEDRTWKLMATNKRTSALAK